MAANPKEGEKSLLSGLFADGAAAERAYQACVERGYEIEDVNVLVSEDTRRQLLATGDEAKAELVERKAEGGELGGPTGGRTGILMTVFAAAGAAILIPTAGVIVGPVAVALTAAGAAGATAGLISVLADWGVPAKRIRRYERDIGKGAILVAVATRSEDDARALAKEWKALGGRDIVTRPAE